ncbi:MAG: hypothetical protein AAF901_13395, partial [Bacteroidota bacterium]
MRFTLFTLVITLATHLFSQSIDVTGTWIGSSTFMQGHSQLKFTLTQKGNEITGEVEAKAENSSDRILYTVKGSIKGTKVSLTPIDIIEKSGLTCMSKSSLSYQLNSNQPILAGRWKGDAKLNTCPPLISGSITLIKEKEVEKVVVKQNSVEIAQKVANSDAIGQA